MKLQPADHSDSNTLMCSPPLVDYSDWDNGSVEQAVVSFPDPPKRKGGSGEYSTTSHYGLAVNNTAVCT